MNVLVKFSGEFFTTQDEMTPKGVSILKQIYDMKMLSGYIVVGGGNRVRGKNSDNPRNVTDQLGVISTIMNAFILKKCFDLIGVKSVVFSHFADFGQKYTPEKAMEVFNEDKWVILASGLGMVGYISTDLSSVIKALEVNAEAVIKVTNVDGIYDKNPNVSGAQILHKTNHNYVLENKLEVMDLAAIAIAAENELPIGVCGVNNFERFLKKEQVGTVVGYDWR